MSEGQSLWMLSFQPLRYTQHSNYEDIQQKKERPGAPGGIFVPILNVNQSSIRTPPAGLSGIYHTALYHTASPPHVQSAFSQRSINSTTQHIRSISVQSAFNQRSVNSATQHLRSISVQSSFSKRSVNSATQHLRSINVQSSFSQRSVISD